MTTSPDWLDRAVCRQRGLHPDLFVPASGPPSPEAVAACAACPVRAECRAERRGAPGLWGGVFVPLSGSRNGRLTWVPCARCGSEFATTGGRRRYCSGECRMATRGAA